MGVRRVKEGIKTCKVSLLLFVRTQEFPIDPVSAAI